MTEYQIGGKFLDIMQTIYAKNEIFIKLSGGLTKSFVSKIGVKQGDVLSPILFNLYINKLPTVYNNTPDPVSGEHCDPVYIKNKPINCLMWADDCVVFSLSQAGLQHSINLTVKFFSDLDLSVNVKKTKVMIFNPRGPGCKKIPKLNFLC